MWTSMYLLWCRDFLSILPSWIQTPRAPCPLWNIRYIKMCHIVCVNHGRNWRKPKKCRDISHACSSIMSDENNWYYSGPQFPSNSSIESIKMPTKIFVEIDELISKTNSFFLSPHSVLFGECGNVILSRGIFVAVHRHLPFYQAQKGLLHYMQDLRSPDHQRSKHCPPHCEAGSFKRFICLFI